MSRMGGEAGEAAATRYKGEKGPRGVAGWVCARGGAEDAVTMRNYAVCRNFGQSLQGKIGLIYSTEYFCCDELLKFSTGSHEILQLSSKSYPEPWR